MTFRPHLVTVLVLLGACSDDGATSPDPADAAAEISDVGAGDAGEGGAPQPQEWVLALDETPAGALMNVWGPPGGNIWTVGGQLSAGDAPGARAVFVRADSGWEAVEVPAGPMLNWVHGADGLAWMVGEQGRALLWRDGAFVEEIQTPTTATLWGVWCASASQCWSVGGDPNDSDSRPVMLRWDGTSWAAVDLPTSELPSRALYKVWGTGPSDVHAVGSRGIAYHYDGTAWAEVATGATEDIISLWGRAPNEVIAVGGRIQGTVGRWDGEAWEFRHVERSPGLNGAWMGADGVAWIVGANGRIARVGAGSFEADPVESPASRVLHGVWAPPEGPVIAVGGSLDRPLPWVGTLVEGR
jgi:hypothetical protein